MSRRKIPTLSLFTGAGGLDIGFHTAGFEIVACVELEPAYCRTLQENTGRGRFFGNKTIIHCEDVAAFDPSPYRKLGIQCVIGGPPCQTFSAAGRRAGGVIGTRDERGRLFSAYCNILENLTPNVFIFENVYGLPGANGGGPWREIVSAFSALGYDLHAEVLDAADYGVPQHRERLFLIGHKEGSFKFPMPTHGPDSDSGLPLVSTHSVIENLQDDNEPYHDGLGGLYGHLLPLVPEGLNYAFFTAEMGHPEPQFAWRSKFHDLLYKVNRHEPCRTIKAQPGKFTGPFHWKNRHFTVEELKRLQTFPASYVLCGTDTKIQEQIGNSVPPRLAEVIAVSVREQFFTKPTRQTYPPRPAGFKSTFRQRQRERSKRFKEIARQEIARRYGSRAGIDFSRPLNETYYFEAKSLFGRERKKRVRTGPKSASSAYRVEVDDLGGRVDIAIKRRDTISEDQESLIEISGLSKYLGRIDEVFVNAKIREAIDIFHVWKVVEDTLVERSRFFSLIDIYGHYANRGDTVRISGAFAIRGSRIIRKALNFFTDSARCGAFIPITALTHALSIDKEGLESIISRMRAIRYDIRTESTHPIIGKDRVLCTYPFPLLSPRALVESRANLIAEPVQQYLV